MTDTSNRVVELVWNAVDSVGCADAILCVTGPDGETWKYIGEDLLGAARTQVHWR